MHFYSSVVSVLTDRNRTVPLIAFLLISLGWSACYQQGNKTSPAIKEDLCIRFDCELGAIVRGDTSKKSLTLVFTGDEFADGGEIIRSILKQQQVPGAFFFTGNFYRNQEFEPLIQSLVKDGHYIGAHSDQHLLYCDWKNRDSLLVTRVQFLKDLEANYQQMERFEIKKEQAPFFLPPYEWYNDSISKWTAGFGLQLINFTHGTRSHTDYTIPGMPNYQRSETIYRSIMDYESKNPTGLNGFILLSHIGTAPEREDKFYLRLEELIRWLKMKGYNFQRLDEFLGPKLK